MKVLVDFREGAKEQRAGKGEYVRQLVMAMIKQTADIEMVLLVQTGQIVDLPRGNWKVKSFGGGRIFWHFLVGLWCEICQPADLYFATTSVIIPAFLIRVPSVVTIFDFTTWRYPAGHIDWVVRLEKMLLPLALWRSSHILSISNFTSREAQKLFNTPQKKITTTLLGVGSEFKPFKVTSQDASRLKKAYNLPEKFVLYLGTLEPRKNIPFLILAFNSIKEKHPGVMLVLAGNLGWQSKEIEMVLTQDIVVTGYIKEADKPALYNMAEVFIFPSLYEGFGMPPLEAMACGVPTIVSDQASLPEVVRHGALTIDISSIKPLAYTLGQILSSVDLQDSLGLSGISRAHELTWESTAERTMEVLKLYGPRREF
jgi:glycosyltransferase involved in cell wall biosynthesis